VRGRVVILLATREDDQNAGPKNNWERSHIGFLSVQEVMVAQDLLEQLLSEFQTLTDAS
jgi:hypothetical protein